jgi:hypothetical protein
MKKILDFKDFSLLESTAAGNRELSYKIPFSYTSNDPKEGYSSKSFVSDLESVFIDKPHLKKEISEFLSGKVGITKISDLSNKPISFIIKLIPEIERIIDAGEYEPELTMPGGGLLFIRNKKFSNGKSADFYINRKGTKIEVVTEDELGKEKVMTFEIDRFPFDRFEFKDEEREELNALRKAKGV